MNSFEPRPFQIHTFGCKVNTYDTGLLSQNITRRGFEAPAETRVHILNTCAVTAEATKEAVRLVRRLKAKDPFCTVVVTGCGAQVDTGSFDGLAGVDLVIANSHKMEIPQILSDFFKGKIQDRVFKSNIFKKEDLEEGGGEEGLHTRSFLKIQDGCNSFCTYCVIPYARGKSRSVTIESLVRRVQTLHGQGVQEVVLTGVHIGDYEDLVLGEKKNLEDLIEQILVRTKIPRIRLTSLEPVEVSDRLIEMYSDSRLCAHFHMSIQSANSEVLAAMKRKYTQAEVRSSLHKIEKMVPNAFVGMDVIAGFASETHEQFEDTYLCLSELPWSRLHVFPYSERPGTKALQLPATVDWSERVRRASRLRELSSYRMKHKTSEQLGQDKEILLLKRSKSTMPLQVLSRDYWSIDIENDSALRDQPVDDLFRREWKVRVVGARSASDLSREGTLLGHIEVSP